MRETSFDYGQLTADSVLHLYKYPPNPHQPVHGPEVRWLTWSSGDAPRCQLIPDTAGTAGCWVVAAKRRRGGPWSTWSGPTGVQAKARERWRTAAHPGLDLPLPFPILPRAPRGARPALSRCSHYGTRYSGLPVRVRASGCRPLDEDTWHPTRPARWGPRCSHPPADAGGDDEQPATRSRNRSR